MALRFLPVALLNLHRREKGAGHHINLLKPHLTEQWVIAPDGNAAFVAAMAAVLDVYHRPRDPACPLVCLDETSKQLIKETRSPIR
jgi:hypothetical protein